MSDLGNYDAWKTRAPEDEPWFGWQAEPDFYCEACCDTGFLEPDELCPACQQAAGLEDAYARTPVA